MISIKKYLCLITIFSLTSLSKGQFYNTGQAPSSISWMQIKTDKFQIIYPSGFYSEANRAANLLEYTYKYSSEEYSKVPKKITVILYNQSVRSNGYVVWAPKRAEWITTPPQDTYVQDWFEQLALHEYRHVVQLSNLEQGMTKVLNLVFGQMITGVVAAYLPFWFLEGDAVVNETALSSTGRGRSPDFNLELRTMEMEKAKRYSYDQSYLGSYKHFVPDHYKYGYHMVSYAKLKYDNNIWRQTIDKVGKRPYLGAPFYFGLKKNGAKSKVKLYHETFDSLNTLWKSEAKNNTAFVPEYIQIPKSRQYTNYTYVQHTPYGVFAVKTSINDISRFVLLKESSDSIIHTPGRYSKTPVNAGQKYVVWTEYLPHVRWQQKDYSVIKLLELANGKVKQLTNKSRYFAPSLSPSDERVACIQIDEQNQYSLVILNSFNGESGKKITFPSGMQIYQPVWLNEEILLYISMANNNKQIEQISILTEEKKVLFQSGLTNISYLHAKDSVAYFSYDLEKERNIYALCLNTGKVFKASSSKYGADFPFVKDSFIYYSDYTLNGYVPAKSDLNPSDWENINKIEKYNYKWAESLSNRAGTNIQKDTLRLTSFDTGKYNRLLNSFYLHSWTPFYFDVQDFTSLNPVIYPGITLLSQNKLSTITSSVSYFYSDQTHYLLPKITIARFFPVFEVSAMFSNRSSFLNTYNNLLLPENPSTYKTVSLRIYLPLDLTKNKYNRYLQPGIGYNYTNEYYLTDTLNYELGYDYINLSIYLSNLLKNSPKDIYSRYGQTLYLAMINPIMDNESFSLSQLGVFNLYLPGLFKHHSVRFYVSGEKKDVKFFARSNSLFVPRGYLENINYSSMIRWSVDYTLPIFYPDWSIGPFAYIKRFHASIFYDAAKLTELRNENNKTIVSTGITLASEMHFLRFFVPFTPKVTFAFLPDENSLSITFGLSIESSIF